MIKIHRKINPNSQQFYKKHPDLAPRNVYLASGRKVNMEQIEKELNKAFKLSFKEKCCIWFSSLKQKFQSIG